MLDAFTQSVIGPFRGEYAFLSNYHPAPVVFEGILYPTVEHAYQAAKTLDQEERRRIANLPTPGQAKRAGRRVQLRPDWENVKIDVMTQLLRRKFTCYPDLGEKLLATGDLPIVEINWWNDTFWGVCGGRGENNLGKLLMAIREELRTKQEQSKPAASKVLGKVYLYSFWELSNINADVRLFVVRQRPRTLPSGWIWVPQMAPSEELFCQYRAWVRAGQWPAKWPVYEQRFKAEMPAMRRYLDRVEEHLRAGRAVALACYCQDPAYCHRRIFGEYFQAKGYPVA